jgi:hypothetical protein
MVDISSLHGCAYVHIYVCAQRDMDVDVHSHTSSRVEMKKFADSRAPLNLMKVKLTLKIKVRPEYKVFADELANIIQEQQKFIDEMEYTVAESEAIDKAEALKGSTFFF